MLRLFAIVFFTLASSAAAAEKPVVAAVNYPLAYFAERLGGDAVEVLFPIPSDRDPAFWRPKLADISAIQQADVIALNGAGYAAWTTKASLPRSRIVNTSAGFKSDYIQTETITHSHGEDGEHSHEGIASHTWLDFALAARQAEALAAGMERRMPKIADEIEAALPKLLAELKLLDEAAQKVGAALSGVSIIATHPRYQYFARAYGLDIHSLEWEAGEAPTEAQWAELDALSTQTGAQILIWEEKPPSIVHERVKALGLRDTILPVFANKPEERDFIAAMQADLGMLAKLARE